MFILINHDRVFFHVNITNTEQRIWGDQIAVLTAGFAPLQTFAASIRHGTGNTRHQVHLIDRERCKFFYLLIIFLKLQNFIKHKISYKMVQLITFLFNMKNSFMTNSLIYSFLPVMLPFEKAGADQTNPNELGVSIFNCGG